MYPRILIISKGNLLILQMSGISFKCLLRYLLYSNNDTKNVPNINVNINTNYAHAPNMCTLDFYFKLGRMSIDNIQICIVAHQIDKSQCIPFPSTTPPPKKKKNLPLSLSLFHSYL